MDATKIDFEKEFDIVTTSLSFHEMPKEVLDSVLREMVRVLKSEGKTYILEWDRPRGFWGRLLFGMTLGVLEPKGFDEFLEIDWYSYLSKNNLKVEEIEKLAFTKIIIASKIA
jgi:ubiquinone/menaquinone biosynthesis C-methylase UbiE